MPALSECGIEGSGCGGIELVESGFDDTGVGLGEEECHTATLGGEDVMLAVWQALDESLAPQAAQVIGHLMVVIIGPAKMSCYQWTQAGVGESIRNMTELAKAGEERHYTWIAKAKPRCALAIDS